MFDKVLGRISDVFGILAGVALVLMMLHITAEVIARYVFDSPLHGTVEIVSTYYMVAVVFLPLALIERVNGHIIVELVSKHLPERSQEILIGVVSLVSAAFFLAFAWQTWGDALSKYEIGEQALGTVAVTVWPTRFYIPFGCALLAVVFIHKAVLLFRGDNSVLQTHLADTSID